MQSYNQIKRILIFILGLNWLVALLKLIFGYFINSVSMIADGFHSLSDGASNIIGLIGISVASKPADREHLYGHKKYETLATLVIAVILFLIAFNIFLKSVQRLSQRSFPNVELSSFVVMVIGILINLFVYRYEQRKGKQLNSDILISDSFHTLADIFTSFSVIIALLSVRLGFPLMDTFVSIIISLFIAYTGLNIARKGSRILCDTAVIEIEKIEKIVRQVPEVIDCHKIRTRGRADDVHIDLHVLVKPDMHMEKAHQISYEIEERIKNAFPQVTDIVVHMESINRKRAKGGGGDVRDKRS